MKFTQTLTENDRTQRHWVMSHANAVDPVVGGIGNALRVTYAVNDVSLEAFATCLASLDQLRS